MKGYLYHGDMRMKVIRYSELLDSYIVKSPRGHEYCLSASELHEHEDRNKHMVEIPKNNGAVIMLVEEGQ